MVFGFFTDPTAAIIPPEVTVGPEKIVAATDRDRAQQALGNALPIVIGTGRVDGTYIIGGVSEISTTTTHSHIEEVQTPDIEGLGRVYSGTGGSLYNTSGFGGRYGGYPQYQTITDAEVTTQSVTRAGYVLAYDVFEEGYDLIRLEVDGLVVFDVESAVGTSTTVFRFYGGRHTTVDPILADIIGANAGAYQNFVMVFVDGYPSNAPPGISAVISNASEATGPALAYITGDYSNSTWFPETGAYEPSAALIYVLVYADDSAYGVDTMHVLSVDTLTEIFRFPWPTGTIPYPISGYIALPGSDYILASENAAPSTIGVVNATLGTVVATATTFSHAMFICATTSSEFPSTWIALGQYLTVHSGIHPNSVLAVFESAGPSLQLIEMDVAIDQWSLASPGRTLTGSVSFFAVKWLPENGGADNDTIVELTYDGSASVAEEVIYTVPAGYAHGIHYDPQTGYLVVPVANGGVHSIHIVNPNTGALIQNIPTAVALNMLPDPSVDEKASRLFPSPGHALLYDRSAVPGKVWSLDLASMALELYAEDYAWTQPSDGIFDQNHGIWMDDRYPDASNGYWTVHRAPYASPMLIPLQEIVTDAMSLAGFSPSDLAFEGFTGLSSYGFVIASDTTIQNVIRSISDIYGFAWCDTGSGFSFKKAGQGDLLSIDASFTAVDIVERPQPVLSTDEANIRTPSAVEMEYQSKEGDYRSRPASFAMPVGVLNSITTPKLSTPILMNDLEAQRIVTEKFFEYQEKRRDHNLVVAPEYITLLPGDIVSFPSGNITYIARVEQIAVDLRNMGVDISAKDFQTEVETAITAVSNNAGTLIRISTTSQYVHLDVPLLNYSEDAGGDALVQYGMLAGRGQENWSGAWLYRGVNTQSFAAIFNQAPHQGVIGVCTTVLNTPSSNLFATDDVSVVTIRMTIGSAALLVDRTEAEVLAGQNNAFIGAPGRWEWVGYKNVVDNGDSTFTLSGFSRRGHRGSEVFASSHVIGDVFVLDSAIWVHDALNPLTDLGKTRYYRAVGIGQNPAAAPVTPHVITGTAETPYACVNLLADVGGSGGIDISWDYRSRLTEGLNPAEHGEATLAFQVDIYDTDATTYIRTLTTATNSVHYASANVITDFGVDPPADCYFRVYMMSALPILVAGQDRPVEGRGYEARGHFPTVMLLLSGDMQSGTDHLDLSGSAGPGNILISEE